MMKTNKYCVLLLLYILNATNFASDTTEPHSPVNVNVSFYIIDVEAINNIKQEFTIDFIVRLKWKDSSVVNKNGNLTIDDIWNPNIHIYNEREIVERFSKNIVLLPGDTIQYTQRIYGQLSGFLDFHDFPFDRQTLPITLVTFGYSPDQVKLNFEYGGREDLFSISGWEVIIKEPTSGKMTFKINQGENLGIERARLDYFMEASRQIDYYWWKILVPLMVIVMLSWAVFWIDPSQIGAQIGVSATSILTLIAFFLRLENIIPQVSYLTHMDYFIFSSLILVFLAYIEALTSSTNALKGRKDIALIMDKWSRFMFPALFLVIVVIFWIV